MHLQQLILTNFKNYEFHSLEFAPRFNCFTGPNGIGKTNLLDAIYFLCMTKSHFPIQDKIAVRHEADFFRLEGHFQREGKSEKVVVKLQKRKKKVIERNDIPYKRFSEHIGLLPVVMVAPDDTALAKEGSEERRRFLDNTLSQQDTAYLQQLIRYNRLLKQRNALLKSFAASHQWDAPLLHSINEQMIEPAQIIFEKRQAFITHFTPVLQENYEKIAQSAEQVSCTYRSKLSVHSFASLLQENEEKDRILQRTTAGIHRDDLLFTIHDRPLKVLASQGQLKSYILALRLSQYELLHQKSGVLPLLLLDDIFDKLDHQRVEHLVNLLLEKNFGQIFITDTDRERVRALFQRLDKRHVKLFP